MYRARYTDGGSSLLSLDYQEALDKMFEIMKVIENTRAIPERLKFRREPNYTWELYQLGSTYALLVKGLPPVTLDALLAETIGQNMETEA